MYKSEDYPPGCDRRLVDWVRFPESLVACSNPSCNSPVSRLTESGILCLTCYRLLISCNEPGCHVPALDVPESLNASSKRKGWILKCRDHYYDVAAENELLSEQQDNMRRGSCYLNGCTF